MQEFGRPRRACAGSFIVDRAGTILGFDLAMERLTGWPAIDVVGLRKGQPGEPHDPELGSRRTTRPPLFEGEIPLGAGDGHHVLTLNRRDGRRLDTEVALRLLPGPGDRALVTVLSVLARSAGDEATHRVRIDSLTGLLDRTAFQALLDADFQRAWSEARPLALVIADVDHLREVNCARGRAAGDDVLQKLSGILRVTVEDETRIARIGDDDFAVLLPGAGRGEARQLAAALRSTVERFRFGPDAKDEMRLTLSLGAASFPADAESADDLLERAYDALGEARSFGRNRVWCYLRRPRVPLQVPVYFDGAESLLVGYSRDLSPSGIFVQTAGGIDVGMRCALAFPLPGLAGRVHAVGRVVRSVPPELSSEASKLRVPGIGLEFERFARREDRRAIESFLHRNESRTWRPERGRLSV